ncbi:hypothetical protein ACFQZO_30770 [Bradyrhizobium sp. GCM10027634]|uniref:hypothetical protein n=1 Tax=unclassified Bradyrhizobium TaxID=2631580 RepID=UPI00263B62F1|nr:hypothetical protein [Bradyrhizobium sp. WYCCWR 12677]MDN5005244.1 hypothetical protein [Bradyrhizobium sp. WYCCWR 12677]
MQTRRNLLLALSLILIGTWSQDGARGRNSATPPVSLAPPNASPPHAVAKNAKPRREPAVVTNDSRAPATSGGEPPLPVIGGPALPNPAADYDGFSASTDDNDAPSHVTPPARSRAAKGSNRDTTGLDAQSSIDQEDEALKRKLTICRNCK